MLKTIEEVFSENVRALRGKETQFTVSERARIPFSTYQTMEAGVIPAKKVNLLRLAKYHGVPETRFFLDQDLTEPTPEQALNVLAEFISMTSVEKSKIQREIADFNENQIEELVLYIDGMKKRKPKKADEEKEKKA